jgi:sulfite reductase alpha subunit-like flavoprotein
MTHQLSLRLETLPERPIHLYFGCRHPCKDFYFSDEWSAAEKKWLDVRIKTAFSRPDDSTNCQYVQDLMQQDSEDIYRIIFKENGSFFVAGRAKQMPDQVTTRIKTSGCNAPKF